MIKAYSKISPLLSSAVFSLGIFCNPAPAQAGQAPASSNIIGSGAIPPALKIDGNSNFNAYVVNQQRRENGRGGPQPHFDNGVSNIYFSVIGQSSNGVEYMFRVTLETVAANSNVIDQNYLQFKGSFGTFQLGCVVGPEDTTPKDAGKVVGGTGAFDGAYNNVYNMSAGVMRGNDNIGDTGNATKIVYYSPELAGWQLGIAYTPNTSHFGKSKLDTTTGSGIANASIPGNRGLYDGADTSPFDLRNVAIGLTYRKEMGKWSITLSGAGITAKSYFYHSSVGRVSFQDTRAYQLGMLIGYGDWRFGGGYLNNGKSHLPRTANFTYNKTENLGSMNNGNAGSAWNVGAGYTLGAYQFALSYQGTTRNTGDSLKARSSFYSATADVTILTGLKAYGEVDYIKSKTNSQAIVRQNSTMKTPSTVAIGNNSGVIGIVGAKISF